MASSNELHGQGESWEAQLEAILANKFTDKQQLAIEWNEGRWDDGSQTRSWEGVQIGPDEDYDRLLESLQSEEAQAVRTELGGNFMKLIDLAKRGIRFHPDTQGMYTDVAEVVYSENSGYDASDTLTLQTFKSGRRNKGDPDNCLVINSPVGQVTTVAAKLENSHFDATPGNGAHYQTFIGALDSLSPANLRAMVRFTSESLTKLLDIRSLPQDQLIQAMQTCSQLTTVLSNRFTGLRQIEWPGGSIHTSFINDATDPGRRSSEYFHRRVSIMLKDCPGTMEITENAPAYGPGLILVSHHPGESESSGNRSYFVRENNTYTSTATVDNKYWAAPTYETYDEASHPADSTLFYQDLSRLVVIVRALQVYRLDANPAA